MKNTLENEINEKISWFNSINTEFKAEFILEGEITDTSEFKFDLIHNWNIDIENGYACKAGIESIIRNFNSELENKYKHKHLKSKLNFKKSTDNTIMKKSTKEESSTIVFVATKPRYNFNQIIIPNKLKEDIDEAIGLIANQELIYTNWGFSEVDPIPKSVLNFYGPPGTGKTMTAHAIANELNKPLLALNYSEIESKFVGEAPKNLSQAFKQAKEENAVLFFDEADSFLGKRIENVSNGSDQSINSLRSQMLILLEEFGGVVIFATNLVSNFDKAFESRILKHLHFDLPNLEARAEIIKNKIPSKLPLANNFNTEDYLIVANIAEGLSGREIKGVILETLLKKANVSKDQSVFELNDFTLAFENKSLEKKQLEEETKSKLKGKISNAIKRKLDQNKIDELILCCKFGFHVMWADGIANDFEKQTLQNFIDGNQLDITIPTDIEELEPLENLISENITKSQKENILDFMIKILSVGYDISDLSENKVIEIMNGFKESKEFIETLSGYIKSTQTNAILFKEAIKLLS